MPARLHRRRFLLGSASALALGGLCSVTQARTLKPVRRESLALGSKVVMTVLHEELEAAEQALDAAFAELERIENVMSLYREDSQICRLNRDGVLESPDPYLVEVLRFARQIAESSDGAFDITVQPLWSLHAEAKKQSRTPRAAELQAAREKVDWRRVEAGTERVRLHGDGTAITLNAIAQGFAADVSLRVLREHGVRHALVDTGELGAIGRNSEGEPWKIGIQHPRQEEAFAAVTLLQDRFLATTGDYQTAFSADFTRHHVFDPGTGASPGELASVSVLAPTGVAADALATTLMVLGAARGLEWLQRFADTDALLIFKNGHKQITNGFSLTS